MEGEIKEFNRLIIVGNGFDIACGLKSRFSDFVLDYLRGCLMSVGFASYTDEFLNLRNVLGVHSKDLIEEVEACKSVKRLFTIAGTYKIEITFNSKFFQILAKSTKEYGWVDIEKEYFAYLIKVYNGKSETKIKQIEELNSDIATLGNLLETYLRKQLDSTHTDFSIKLGSMINSFSNRVDKRPRHTSLTENSKLKRLCVLNFNYTALLEGHPNLRCPDINDGESLININIHGQLNTPENPMIFGYGDDTSEEYRRLEGIDDNIFLEHMKSPRYSLTENYHSLLHFISEREFEVYVVGHSCGLSDKTLLKTIFEHDNCKNIKVYYYPDKDDHRKKIMAISRLFDDKQMMRNRIMSVDDSGLIPQASGTQYKE